MATLQALGGHVVHIVNGEAQPLEYSGLLYVAGGLVLVGVAVADFRSPADVRAAGPPQTDVSKARIVTCPHHA